MMSIFALILGLGSFLAFYGGTFNCLLMEIDGFLYESEPFVWTDTLDVRKMNFCEVSVIHTEMNWISFANHML